MHYPSYLDALTLGLGVAFAALLVLEQLRPVRRLRLGTRLFHLKYLLVIYPLFRFFMARLTGLSYALVPHPLVNLSALVREIPLPAFSFRIAALLAADLGFYAAHRLLHSVPFLWRIHRLHHSDPDLNAMSVLLNHFLEIPIHALAMLLPMLLLFESASHFPSSGAIDHWLVALFPLPIFFAAFSHSNVRLGLGPATPFVCGPQFHRIHHSRLRQHQNRNFAMYFPFIDWVFGTYHHPAREEWPVTGLHGETRPPTQWQAHTLPWRRPNPDKPS